MKSILLVDGSDGEQALRVAQEHLPDHPARHAAAEISSAILCTVKKDRDTTQIPVVALSSL